MASGTINMSSSGYLQGRITWSSTPNTSTNTSTITARLQAKIDIYSLLGTDADVAKFTISHSLSAFEYDGDRINSVQGSPVISFIHNTWTTVQTLTFSSLHFNNGSNYVHISAACSMKSGNGSASVENARLNLDTIARQASLTAAPNFNDEENPIITYSNPAGNSVSSLQACISLDTTRDDIIYRDIPKTGTSYTFNLTTAERDVLRKATLNGSNKRKVWFYVKTVIGGNTYHSSLEKELTIINATPDVNAYWWDSDAACYALTNNNEVFIKGYSNLSYTLSGTPKKHATIKQYWCTVDYSHTRATPYDGSQDAHWNIKNDKITLEVWDNRGLKGILQSPLYMVDYFPPTCKWEVAELEPDREWAEDNPDTVPTEEANNYVKAKVEISGKFFNDKFGPNGVTNVLKVETKHSKINNEWGEVHEILWGDNVNGNDYKVSFYIRGIYYTDTFKVQFRVSDKLVTQPIEIEEKTLKYLPVFDWSNENFNFNVPIRYMGKDIDFVIETGTASMGSNGTWYWSKWASGKAECYGVRNFGNMAVTTAWGSLYQSDYFSQNLPSGLFVAAPQAISIDFYSTTNTAYGWITKGGSVPTATNTGQFFVTRGTGTTLSAAHISFNVVGRWK